MIISKEKVRKLEEENMILKAKMRADITWIETAIKHFELTGNSDQLLAYLRTDIKSMKKIVYDEED